MADTTISSLPLGTPSSSALLPYSQDGSTLSVSPSALLQNVGNIGIGTSNPRAELEVNGGVRALSLSATQGFYYPPDYDSGWFNMSSQAGANSFKQLNHNLNQYPAYVKVLVRAVDGNNLGYIFEGMGAAQNDDDGSSYGGLIFGYNQTSIRLWAPTKNNNSPYGYIINIQDGWGNETFSQDSNNAQVRVLAWKGFFNLI
jgi:hypothetical protein